MSRDEGVIKFQCRWQQSAAPSEAETEALIDFRQQLFRLGLIGVYPDGIGYGNLSHRRATNRRQFIISASQTGHLESVSADDFALVTDYSIGENWVQCTGSKKASSESLTHAMVYEQFASAQAVIHVHHGPAWQRLLDQIPTTRADVPYGTPAMAEEVRRLAAQSSVEEARIFVMAGHEDGILSFGATLEQALKTITDNLALELQSSAP